MSGQYQSATRVETECTSEFVKKRKGVGKHKKINKTKSQISKESGATTSLKEKIICYLYCCCHYGEST